MTASPSRATLLVSETPHSSSLGNIANRISYFFDFKGPSLATDTACSSAMTALYVAMKSLVTGDCDRALVLGVNISPTCLSYIGFSQASMLSPTGTSRPFDVKGNGFVRADGCGCIVIERQDLLQPLQRVYCELLDCCINEDGKTKSLTLPSEEQQAELIRYAFKKNSYDMGDVVYMEAHGTGTGVGDPIEGRSIGTTLGQAVFAKRHTAVHIGSVKGNVGHMETGAAMAGIIKCALCIYHDQLVPTVGHETLNPKIKADELHIKIQVDNEKLSSLNTVSRPLVTCNSYGFGGSNGNCIMAPYQTESAAKPAEELNYTVLPLSCHYEEGLNKLVDKWKAIPADHLLNDITIEASLNSNLKYRSVFVGPNSDKFFSEATSFQGAAPAKKPRIAFAFGGQGSQYSGMGVVAYQKLAEFRKAADEFDACFKKYSGKSLIHDYHFFEPNLPTKTDLLDVCISMPGIVLTQYALAKFLISIGIQPSCVMGHSTGEMCAALIAGVFEVDELARLTYERSRGQSTLRPGAMAALGVSDVEATNLIKELHLEDSIDIAAINSATSVSLSGLPDSIDALGVEAKKRGYLYIRLPIAFAFHSRFVEDMKEDFMNDLKTSLHPNKQAITFVSTAKGCVYDDLLDVDYWWSNIRGSVKFAAGLKAIDPLCDVIIEIGPHSVLRGYIKQELSTKPLVLTMSKRNPDDVLQLLTQLSYAYSLGVDIDWKKIQAPRCSPDFIPIFPWNHETPYRKGPWKDALSGRQYLEEYRSSKRSKTTTVAPAPAPAPSKPAVTEVITKTVVQAIPSTLASSLQSQIALTPYEFDYIADHKLKDMIVLPGALYVSLAYEFDNTLDDLKRNGYVQLYDCSFLRFMPWNMSSGNLVLNLLRDTNTFRYMKDNVEYMKGHRKIVHHIEDINVSPLYPNGFADAEARCTKEIKCRYMYEMVAKYMGLPFGKTFQSIQKMKIGDGESVAYIKPIANNNRRLHPIYIDAAYQMIVVSIGLTYSPMVPTHMDSFVSLVPSFPDDGIRIHMKATAITSSSYTADLDLYDNSNNCLAVIRGMTVSKLSPTMPQELDIYEEQWQTKQFTTDKSSLNTHDVDMKKIESVSQFLLSLPKDHIYRVLDLSEKSRVTVELFEYWKNNKVDLTCVYLHFLTHTDVSVPVVAPSVTVSYVQDFYTQLSLCSVDILFSQDAHSIISLKPYLVPNAFVCTPSRNTFISSAPSSSYEYNTINVLDDEDNVVQFLANNGSTVLQDTFTEKDLSNECMSILDMRCDVVKASQMMKRLLGLRKESKIPHDLNVLFVYRRDQQSIEKSTIIGFTRSLRNEYPSIKIYTFSLPEEGTLSTEDEVQNIMWIMEQDIEAEEYEYELDNNGFWRVPRMLRTPKVVAEVKEESKEESDKTEAYRLQIDTPGQLQTLHFHWIDVERESLSDDEVLIDVKGVALHFKDIMLAMNMLKGFQPVLGLECSGIIEKISESASQASGLAVGDKVLCVSFATGPGRGMRQSMMGNKAICKVTELVKAPDDIDLVLASGYLGVMVTAYYCLVKQANITKEDTILIHSAMGGVGLSAIQIAKRAGATIIASAGSEAKRQELLEKYKVDYVIDSHNPSKFVEEVMKCTNNRGVDIVLNSLSGEGMTESFKCLAPCGRFVEIGKRDIMDNNPISLGLFKDNITYYSCHLDLLSSTHPTRMNNLLLECVELLKKGELKPIETQIKSMKDAPSVFRFMAQGKHTGKIVFKIEEDFKPKRSELKPCSTLFSPELTYVFTGATRGMGLYMASWAVTKGARHIILTGSSGKVTYKSKCILDELKKDYSDLSISIESVNLCDEEAVDSFIANVTPSVGGIFHLATQYVDGKSDEITEDIWKNGSTVKMSGAWNLHKASIAHCPKLHIFFMSSSISGQYGNCYQSIYAAANSSLQQLASIRKEMNLPILVVDFPMLLDTGRLSELQYVIELKVNADKGLRPVSAAHVVQLIEKVLIHPRSYSNHITIHMPDLYTYVKLGQNKLSVMHCLTPKELKQYYYPHTIPAPVAPTPAPKVVVAAPTPAPVVAVAPVTPAPVVATPAPAPVASSFDANKLKEKLGFLLGMEGNTIDMSTPLTDLGIDSLGAVELMNWCNTTFNSTISQADILSGISGNELAGKIAGSTPASTPAPTVAAPTPAPAPIVVSAPVYTPAPVIPAPVVAAPAPATPAPTASDSNKVGQLKEKLGFLLGMESNTIDMSTPLTDLGIDSLGAVELMNWCNTTFNSTISQTDILSGISGNELAEKI